MYRTEIWPNVLFLSGATGFIVQHITSKFLARRCRVVDPARSAIGLLFFWKSFRKNILKNLLLIGVPEIAASDAFD